VPTGIDHTTFSLSPDQSVERPLSVDLPSAVGPRNPGQSSPAVRVQRLGAVGAALGPGVDARATAAESSAGSLAVLGCASGFPAGWQPLIAPHTIMDNTANSLTLSLSRI
jgi:hypothetical protein